MKHDRQRRASTRHWRAAAAAIFTLSTATPAAAVTYTSTADFNSGSPLNVITAADELKLNSETVPFNFIWVAVSSKNTIVKIDTTTGAVVGEYWSAPQSSGRGDPSRTTVDKNGSVWVGNRSGGGIVHIGLEENSRCVDRDNSGTIETSTGLGDVRGWPGSTADEALDECIIHFTVNNGSDARHISVDENNDVWVGSLFSRNFDLVDGDTGLIVRSELSVGYGGYGGLIDSNGVIWSAQPMLRWDTSLPLTAGNFTGYDHDSYGLCIDPAGNVWNTALFEGVVRKFDPAGNLIGTYPHGHPNGYVQGCVADANGHIWIAGSVIAGNSVVHLLNDGTFVGVVTVGNYPSGVAVDGVGKIWATNFLDGTVSRIDPALGGIGGGGATIGAVDFTTVPLGGNTYNYSDMTGSTLVGAPDNGNWVIVEDSGAAGTVWGSVSWNQTITGDGAITVTAATSDDNMTFSTPVAVTSGGTPAVPNGRYIRVTVAFTRAGTGQSPVLHDLTIQTDTAVDECGDGIVATTEECDDGNTTNGDGCDDTCVVEPCWACSVDVEPTTTTLPPVTTTLPPVPTTLVPTSTSSTMQPTGDPAPSGPSICVPDNGASCDDGDECTVNDGCSAGTCVGEGVLIPAACKWAVVAGDPARKVRARTRGRAEVVGRICGEEVFIGELSETREIVGMLATGNAIRISRAPVITGDIATGGGAVFGKPNGTPLPGLAVDTVAGGAVVVKDMTSNYDTTGTHALVAECNAAQADIDIAVPLLDGLPSTANLGNVQIGGNGSLTLAPGSPAGVTAGGLNVIDIGRFRTGNNVTVTLDGGGNPGTVYILRVNRKFDLHFKGDIVLTNGQTAGNVIIYGRNKCKFGEETTGGGTVICPEGKLFLEERATWNGALLGGKQRVEIRDSSLLTHVPLQIGN